MKKLLNLAVILLAFFYATSCKTKQQIVSTETLATDSIVILIKNVLEVEPRFNTANFSKMNLSFVMDTRKFNNIAASCKIIRDTAIFLSIQPVFGIEMFSMEITPDSITIIDKMNRKFYTVTYLYLTQKTGIPLNFQNVQALLSNNLFSLGETKVNPLKSKAEKTSEGKRSIVFSAGKIIQKTAVNGNYEIDRLHLASNDAQQQITVNYDQSQMWDITRYPRKVFISGNSNKKKFSCDIEVGRVVFNAPVKLTPASRSNLTRGNIEQILSK